MKKFITLIVICLNLVVSAVSYSHAPLFGLQVPTTASAKLILQTITVENVTGISQVAEIPNVNAVHDVVWSPDGTTIALATGSEVHLYDVDNFLTPRLVFKDHTAIVLTLTFSPDGRSIASGSADGTIRIWSVETGVVRSSLIVHSKAVPYATDELIEVYTVAFSPDGQLLAYGTARTAEVFVWDLRDNHLTIFEHPHNQFIKSIVFSRDGLSLISGGGWNSTIESWDLKSKQSLLTIEEHSDGIFQLSIDPTGTLLVSASWDGTIMLWDMAVNKRQAVSQNIDTLVTDVSFNGEGTLLASGTLDGDIRFYDSQSAKEIWQVNVYEAFQIMSVSFNPNGTLLAVSNQDTSTVQLWGVQ